MPEVLLHRDDRGVALLTLAAPERRNAITLDMAREMVAACDEIDRDTSIGAVVVRAEGPAFCAGADRALLTEIAQDPASDVAFSTLDEIYQSFLRVSRLRPPTIAAVRGAAVGAGLNLALATDLRVVGHETKLISGFLPIGAHPGGGHFTLLERLVGREAAAAMGLFGVALSGREAEERGLAWASLPNEEVESKAVTLASEAAANPELARRTVQSFRLEMENTGTPLEQAVLMEQATQMWSFRRGPFADS